MRVEHDYGDRAVIIMIGECLQLLLKQAVRACIHRVIRPVSGHRYSCPLLMRGRRDQTIDWHREGYHHEGSPDVLAALEGVSLDTIHTMLDLKRKKCAAKSPDTVDWVLAAFPTSLLAVTANNEGS
jgi:hypothetical protein